RRDVADKLGRGIGPEPVSAQISVGDDWNLDLEQVCQRGIDGFKILLDHLLALAGIGLFRRLLDRRNRLVARHNAGEREEAGLQDGVGARSETQGERDLRRVDDVKIELLVDDLLLHLARQLVPDLVRAIRAVEEQGAFLGGAGERIDLEQKIELVHANEVRRLEKIRRTNGLWTETQMGDREGA